MAANRSLVFTFLGDDKTLGKTMHSLSGQSRSLQSHFATLAGALGVGGLTAGLVGAVKSAATFETTMRQIAVATNEPASAIKGLSDLAIKMGQDTVFSAQDASAAMLELAKSGLSAADLRAGALSSTLTLASAGGLELADAANYLTSGLALFNLKAKDSASVAAALAGAANASRADVSDMGLALSQVGPGAAAAGLSLQETTGVLAAFAQNGILGSDAGTSLKTMLARLTPQTKKAAGAMEDLGLKFTDAHGAFLPIDNIAGQLQKSFSKLFAAQRTTALNTIFGSDASRAALILSKEGAKGIRDFTKATSDKTQAEKMAKAATDGTAGALSQLSGSIDTAKLQLGQALAPLVVDLAKHMSGWAGTLSREVIPAISGFVQGIENGTGAGGDFASAVGEVGDAAKTAWTVSKPFFSFIGDHPKLFTDIAIGAAGLAASMKVIGGAKSALGILGAISGKGGVAGIAGKGVTPVFVTNMGPGGLAPTGPGIPPGPAGGSKWNKGVLGITPATVLATGALNAAVGIPKDMHEERSAQKSVEKIADRNATTVKDLQRALSALAQVSLAEQKRVKDRGGSPAIGNPSHPLFATNGLADADKLAKQLRARLNAALIQQDRMDDPKFAAAASARAARAIAPVIGMYSAAGKTAGTRFSNNLGFLLGVPHSVPISLDVHTKLDALGRRIVSSGGQVYVQGRGGKMPVGATGGIVTRPTLALIGEAGPEAVVPLNKTAGNRALPHGLGGGGNIIINVAGSVKSERDLVEVVRQGLAAQARSGKRLFPNDR